MAQEHRLSRRRLLTISAGTLAVAAVAPATPALAGQVRQSALRPLVPVGNRGTILYTQRDATARRGIWNNPAPTMGQLGGPNFPADPNDLGPVVPLPGGFREVFQWVANAGFTQVEFAGYSQHAENQGGAVPPLTQGSTLLRQNFPAYLNYARSLRGFLDEFGLEAIGNHGYIPNTWPGGPNGGMTADDYDRFQIELEFATILGMPYMGTGGDPTGSGTKEAWDLAGQKWEAINDLSWSGHRIRMYPHNHADAYGFLQDGPMVQVTVDRQTGAPLPQPQMVRGESGIRRMQYYLDITPSTKCFCEIDIYWAHAAQHRLRWYYDWDGQRRENVFSPIDQITAQPLRYPLYHAKDGERRDDQPVGTGDGYRMIPFGDPRSDIDYDAIFRRHRPRGYHNPNYEDDSAPGGAGDPGRSLRHAVISGTNMSNMSI